MFASRAVKKEFKVSRRKEKKGYCSCGACVVISVLVLWFFLLLYALNAGFINRDGVHADKIPSVESMETAIFDAEQGVESAILAAEQSVETVIKNVEQKLLRSMTAPANNDQQKPEERQLAPSTSGVRPVLSESAPVLAYQTKVHSPPLLQQKATSLPPFEHANLAESAHHIGTPETSTPSVAAPLVSGNDVISDEYKVVPGPAGTVHIIFSTDCKPFQDWQTLALFHSAKVVNQPGTLTRIASGCSDEKKTTLTELYREMYPDYQVHFTPSFTKDPKTGKSYHFYNKPYGLKHWLQFADPPVPDHTVVVLLDPDMILLRPITTQVQRLEGILYNRRAHPDLPVKIERGHPVGQMYGLGAPWANDHHPDFNRSNICPPMSPCLLEKERSAAHHYAVGPPYIVEKKDLWRIARSWTRFVPRVFEGYPELLAEMYAYSMGAAHEQLPHTQLENYMVSNVHAGGEGWPLVDKLEDPCVPPDETGIFYPGQPLPSVVHYCQGYRAGEIGIMKHRIPKQTFTCGQPLLLEPPVELGFTDYHMKDGKRESVSPMLIKRNAFVICTLHRAINAAALDYKRRMCDAKGIPANYEKMVNVHLLAHGLP